MKPRVLLDENLRDYLDVVRQRDAAIDVVRVGDPGTPPLNADDQEVLRFCEAEQRLLVTQNRKSMPVEIAKHLAAGHHHWGVFRLRPGYGMGPNVDAIHLVWAASDAEEWIDWDDYIPWD